MSTARADWTSASPEHARDASRHVKAAVSARSAWAIESRPTRQRRLDRPETLASASKHSSLTACAALVFVRTFKDGGHRAMRIRQQGSVRTFGLVAVAAVVALALVLTWSASAEATGNFSCEKKDRWKNPQVHTTLRAAMRRSTRTPKAGSTPRAAPRRSSPTPKATTTSRAAPWRSPPTPKAATTSRPELTPSPPTPKAATTEPGRF